MQPPQFSENAPGRLLLARLPATTTSPAAEYHAYITNDLPPSLTFDGPLVRALSDADRALGELAGVGRTMPNPNLLISPFIRREAVLSSKIEGTQTEIADLYAYEAGQQYLPGLRPTVPEHDILEVVNYIRALNHGIDRIASLPISLRLIRELHERLMAGVRGQHAAPGDFRQSQNWIGAAGTPISGARFIPPPPGLLLQVLDRFEKYIHRDDGNPPLVRIALIHYQFEAIHPFVDGNGRIGRLLISLLLHEWGLLPQPLLYLSAYFEQQRTVYYDHLLAVSTEGKWNEWLLFFLLGVTEQAHDATRRAKQLQDLQVKWRDQVAAKVKSNQALRLIDYLFLNPIITIPRVQAALGVQTHNTASKYVRILCDLEILTKVADEPKMQFVAEDILRCIM